MTELSIHTTPRFRCPMCHGWAMTPDPTSNLATPELLDCRWCYGQGWQARIEMFGSWDEVWRVEREFREKLDVLHAEVMLDPVARERRSAWCRLGRHKTCDMCACGCHG